MDSRNAPQGKAVEVENWDQDLDFQGFDDLNFRNFSTNTSATGVPSRSLQHRDSLSRLSAKSEIDDEGEWQLLLPHGDEKSAQHAIADAKAKGVPIPTNVPSSALIGGTIKRLGGKKVKRILGDEWGEDLELPKPGEGGLRLKVNDRKDFPDVLRNVSLASPNPPVPSNANLRPSFMERLQSARAPALDKFKDTADDNDFGDIPTIKIAKSRTQRTIPNFNQSAPKPTQQPLSESFDDDFELPADGELKLSARKEPPRTPASQTLDEFDPDWADGSQGSFGTSLGTRRTNRSSSVTAHSPSVFSPSLSSCLTAESEDEGLDGLVLPNGPLKLDDALKRRIDTLAAQSEAPLDTQPEDRLGEDPIAHAPSPIKEDFLSGIELGDGEVYDSRKLTLNRNIKAKTTRGPSPTRRTGMTLTFTNKPTAVNTRIPKPSGLERPRSKLEPVSESGGPVASYRPPQSRLGHHGAQSAVSGIPTATTSFQPTVAATTPSTPSRRTLANRFSRETLRPEPPTAGNQLLKSKRSMPVLNSRSFNSPARPQPSSQRPASRAERLARPKTPIEHLGAETCSSGPRKPPIPSFSSTGTHAQAQQSAAKPARGYHRPTSLDSNSNENAPVNRPISRLSNSRYRPTTPTVRKDVAPESLVRAAASTRTITKPQRKQAFGDGNELDIFDDLPTSAASEAKFVRHPTGSLSKASNALRSKLYSLQNQSTTSVSRVEATAVPRTPLTPQKNDNNVPSWARDTAASRLARQQRISNVAPPPPPPVRTLAPAVDRGPHPTSNWRTPSTPAKPSLAATRHHATTGSSKRSHKPPPQQKPHLIQGLGPDVYKAKRVAGMQYNPEFFRWEGNENALAPFDTPGSPKRRLILGSANGGALGTPTGGKPALIASFGTSKGVQVVGGMVFDPQRMCWLKMGPAGGNGSGGHAPRSRGHSESGGRSFTTEDDDEDPFAGLDDLEDDTAKSRAGAAPTVADDAATGSSDEERALGEEFDVGPDFVRRQQNEEERWRRKLDGWRAAIVPLSKEAMLAERSAIRELVKVE